MPTINVKNIPVHYREWGKGDQVIVMLHGWPADSSHYLEIGPMLAQSGYKVIVPDFPGWGKTPKPDSAWGISEYRDWAFDFVEALELDQFILFGHSFGGRVSIKFAIKHPYKLNKLILCGAAGIRPDPTTMKRKAFKSLATIGKAIFSLPLMNKLAPLARKVLYRAAGSQDYNNAEGVMKDTIVKVLEEDLSALLPQIAIDTGIIWGSEDGATPLSDGQKMHELIQNSQFFVIEGARHNLPKSWSKELHSEITTFLTE